ncbi:MAG: UDP-N-acetylmuramoyl-L-alanine--D-glutamate ligase [Paludibacteraceae bacterium]|nr:UDP-N-acetylmuramoyl-L-alanine--D-glutamate ligase [Paludibacteraceae bacterium]
MKKLVILGAGESGSGTAILALKQGYEVFVSDMGPIKPQYKQLMAAHGVPFEENGHTESKILDATEVVKSPGIPNNSPLIQKLTAQGTPVLSEIEFAGRYTKARFVCITGSNGKTTTTSLIYDIFVRAGYNVGLAGNIGKSLALQVAEDDKQWYVVELSSFQLDNMYDFRADIAVLMNITPDHMDRYDFCFQNYVDAKLRITQNQTREDAFIYWQGDPVIMKEVERLPLGATLLPFDATTPLPVPDKELSLKGVHNRLNATAATLAARRAGISDDVIAESLRQFAGVEHRLQFVCEKRGVRFINDSKATNVNSCFYALGAMTTPTVLILGGKDKGNDYTEIDALVREKCHTLVYMGLHNEKLHAHFDGMTGLDGQPLRIIDTNNLADCVRLSFEAAHEGDTVLLSPCCASFDLFNSYEDRGDQFMNAVNAL